MDTSLDIIKIALTALGLLVGGCTLIKALEEYKRQGIQKKAEWFFTLRKRMFNDTTFWKVCVIVDEGNKDVKTLSYRDKTDFLSFYEELAIVVKSKMVPVKVAHYMFGYWAIRAWQNKEFWHDIDPNSPYWSIFKDFVEKLESIEKNQMNKIDDINFVKGEELNFIEWLPTIRGFVKGKKIL